MVFEPASHDSSLSLKEEEKFIFRVKPPALVHVIEKPIIV